MKTLIFYHGTDAWMVMMSEAERFEYKQVCSMAIAYLWTLYHPFHEKDMMLRDLMPALKYDEDPTMYLNLMSAMNCLGGMMSGNGLYQYDAFYLTTLHGRAESYARRAFAGGEYALTAFRMYQAAILMLRCKGTNKF